MKLTILSVILLTALVELASSVAIAQRGLSSGQSADRPSAPSNTRVAQNSAPPDPGELFRDCDNCPELVVVPPGDFVMGSNETPYEKPEHSISIRKPFAIGRREVTFAEWDQCADAGACKARPDDHGWGRGDRPVINVSWEDAKLFVAWLSLMSSDKNTAFPARRNGNMPRARGPGCRFGMPHRRIWLIWIGAADLPPRTGRSRERGRNIVRPASRG